MAPNPPGGKRPVRRPGKTQNKPASWRGQGTGESPGEAGNGFSKFRWRQRDVSATGYWMRLLLWTGFIGLMIYALIIFSVRGGRQAPFIAIHISEYYKDRLISPNSFAMEDIAEFRRQWPKGPGSFKTIVTESSVYFVGEDDERRFDKNSFLAFLRDKLESEEPGGPNKDLTFVYISAHGVVDAKGDPCLLMSDSRARSPDTWLRLDDVVKALGEKDKTSKRILILDCVRTFQDPQIGLLYNYFVDRLDDVLFRNSDRNLVIISASSPGENAWAAPELEGTIFGRRLILGLNGAAKDENTDQKISLGELVDFLQSDVQHWASTKRSSRQSPRAIASGAIKDEWREWTVAEAVEHRSAQEAITTIPPYIGDRRDNLANLWHELDTTLSFDVLAAPVQFANLQFELMRLEQLVLAGRAYDKEFGKRLSSAHKLLETLRTAGGQKITLGRSLPLARQAFGDEKRREEKTFYKRWESDPNVAAWKDVVVEASVSARTAGGLLWLERDLASSGVNTGQINALLDVLDSLPPKEATDRPDFVEVHFLRMLAEHLHPGTSSSSIHRAITARQLAERAATPSDYRTHYWTQNVVNQGDASRRLAEDHLFVGAEASLKEADLLWEKVDGQNGLYRQAISQAATISEAYLVRDVSYAMLPHFSNWLLRKARLNASRTTVADLEALNSLIADTHALASQLDKDFNPLGGSPSLHNDDITEISKMSTAIWTGLDELATDVRQVWSEDREWEGQKAVRPWLTLLNHSVISLTNAQRQGGAVQATLQGDELSALLTINSRQRNELRERLLKIIFEDDDTGSTPNGDSGSQQPSAGAADADGFLRLLGSLDRHPALNLLDRQGLDDAELTDINIPDTADDNPASQREHLARQGEAIRTLLSKAEEECKTLANAKKGVESREADRGGRHLRLELAKAERLWRMNAGMLGIEPSTKSVVKQLRAHDEDFQMLWHSHRVLNDFWAASSSQPEEPYFATTSSFLLKSSPQYFHYGRIDLKERLTNFEKLAGDPGVVWPDIDQDAENPNDDRPRVRLGLKKSDGTPEGVAALYLRKVGSLVAIKALVGAEQLPRLSINLSSTSTDRERRDVGFLASDVPGASSVETVALFRGHVRTGAIKIYKPEYGNVLVSFERKQPPATVRIHPSKTKKSHIAIILDYSATMKKKLGEGTRHEAAVTALRRLLNSLANLADTDVQVCLFLYGHRTYLNADHVITPSNWYSPRAESPYVHPNMDVQKLQDWQRLTPGLIDRIMSRLTTSSAPKPWGQTPLFYSIYQALDELREASPITSEKHIIAITDGDNRLIAGPFNEVKEAFEKQALQTHHDEYDNDNKLVQRIKYVRKNEMDVKISIFGILVNNKIDLQKCATFYPVENQEQFSAALRTSVGLHEFSVRGPFAGSRRRTVGEQWKTEQPAGRGRDYVVTIHTDPPVVHKVELLGGEKIDLYYNSASGRLEHHLFNPKGAVHRECEDPDVHVSVLYPDTRSPTKRTFRVAIQNAIGTKFSRRPVGFWATVTPADFSGGKPNAIPVYHFSDLDFVDKMPVPVLQFTVLNWPRNANGAKIDLWFQMKDDIKSKSFNVKSTDSFTVEAIPEATFEMQTEKTDNGYWLSVTEKYGEGATDLQRSRVMASPRPSKTVRTLLKDSGAVRHDFYYRGEFAIPKTVSITARDTIQNKFIGLVEPFQLKLGD